ncbi:MAG: DUF3276 family protein [Treponema sp.]|jgi:hypothetical protein|nr:DUF3276 family protein [Treponema sp.]
MGIRGELFSTRVILQNRTYFFNVKENRLGDLYLNIVESKNRETGGFERQSVILFADDLAEFLTGFDESLRVLDKAVREKKRNAPLPPRKDRGDHATAANPPDHKERRKRVIVKKSGHAPKAGEDKGETSRPKNRKPTSIKVIRREEP